MSYIDDSVHSTMEWEGIVPWMYLDTTGNVTCACGQMLPDVSKAMALPFLDAVTNAPATVVQITTDFYRVLAMAKGHAALYYHQPNSPHLSHSAMLDLLRTDIVTTDSEMHRDWPGWDDFPDPVKQAIIDLDFNLGSHKLLVHFPLFDAAVRAHDWAKAAEQCHRQDISEDRNVWTKNLFLQAATQHG